MNVILLSLIPMIGYGIYDYLISKPSRALSTITLMFVLIIVNTITFSLILLFSGQKISIGWELIYPFLASVTGYLGVIFYTNSLKTGNPGINSSIANAYPALTILLLILVLSILSSIAAISFTFAFSVGSLAIVSAIAACSPVVTTILARLFGNEKLEFIQYIAIGVLVFGIAGLSYFSI